MQNRVMNVIFNRTCLSIFFSPWFIILSIFLNCRNPTSNEQISSSDRLTIHFHAVVSKDFFKPKKNHHVCVRAGSRIGSWDNNLAILQVSRSVKDHLLIIHHWKQFFKKDLIAGILERMDFL